MPRRPAPPIDPRFFSDADRAVRGILMKFRGTDLVVARDENRGIFRGEFREEKPNAGLDSAGIAAALRATGFAISRENSAAVGFEKKA